MGEDAALYNTDFKQKLIQLWENNRSRTYYREGVGTEKSAELMAELAESIHTHILQLTGQNHECSLQQFLTTVITLF